MVASREVIRPFFRPGKCCQRYAAYRDGTHPIAIEIRRGIEELWAKAGKYLDPELPDKARRSFSAAFWELDVASTLLANGYDLVERRDDQGPDVICAGPPRILIEAVSATPGEAPDVNPNSVPSLISADGSARCVPHDPIVLRLRNAIDEKHRKQRKWIEDGTLAASDPFVIAVSAAEIEMAFLEDNLPDVVRTVFPIGSQVVRVNLASKETLDGGFQYRPAVLKANASPVATNLFQDPEYDGISAILYSPCDEVNRPENPGAGFTLIRNPRAANPVPESFFQFGRHYVTRADGSIERLLLSPTCRTLIESLRERLSD